MPGLKKFTPSELLYNKSETKEILTFFFPKNASSITNLRVNNDVRGFAQGLLVEAIDTSFALGFVEALFRSLMTLRPSIITIGKKFVSNSVQHWFAHASPHDLRNIKIYVIVRQRLQLNFRTIMSMILSGLDFKEMVQTTSVPSISQYA